MPCAKSRDAQVKFSGTHREISRECVYPEIAEKERVENECRESTRFVGGLLGEEDNGVGV